MQQSPNESGTATRVTTSATAVLTSANLNLLGIFVPAVLTGQIVNLYVGSTAAGPATNVIGTCTLAANTFYRIPAYCPGGLTYHVMNEDVDLTIFWNPSTG